MECEIQERQSQLSNMESLQMTNDQLSLQIGSLEQSHQVQLSLLQSQESPADSLLVSQLQESLRQEQDRGKQLDYDIQYSIKEFEDMQLAHDKLKTSFKCLSSQ